MREPDEKKNGISRGPLTLMDGGLARTVSPEEQLERDFQEWAARGKAAGSRTDSMRYATRALADIAQHIRHPNRVPARIIGEALDNGASVEWAEGLLPILHRFIQARAKKVSRKTVAYLSGEFERAS